MIHGLAAGIRKFLVITATLFPDQERLASHGTGQSAARSLGDLQKAGQGGRDGNGPGAVNVTTMGTRLDMDLPFELRALEICLDDVRME